jgi:stage III sporulation protein AG
LEKLKNRNKTDYIILILLGVLLMIVAIPTKESDTSGTSEASGDTGGQQQEVSSSENTAYKKQLQKELSELLSQMEGAGKTQVMITFADDGETYLDKNTSKDETRMEETTVVYDNGETESPYVIRQEQPRVEGVVVVAEGGDRPSVEEQIRNAVMSLFGIEAHKVIVVKMSGQEEEK